MYVLRGALYVIRGAMYVLRGYLYVLRGALYVPVPVIRGACIDSDGALYRCMYSERPRMYSYLEGTL